VEVWLKAASCRHSGAAQRNPESSVLAGTSLDSRVRGNDGKGHIPDPEGRDRPGLG